MRAMAAVAGILVLAGCSVAPLDPDTVAVIPPQDAGMDALLVGALDITDDCVTVTTPEGTVTPVFPRSMVAWDDGALVIDGTPHDDGDPVWLGGGGVPAVSDDMHIPEGCPTDVVFLVAG